MQGRLGRTFPADSVTPAGISTGSAYVASAAVGSAFGIPNAAGQGGGLLTQLMVADYGTASGVLRLHLFGSGFSAIANGSAWGVIPADFPNYLGFVNISASAWTPLSGVLIALVADQNIGFFSRQDARVVSAQLQAVNAVTFGNTANPLRVNWIASQD